MYTFHSGGHSGTIFVNDAYVWKGRYLFHESTMVQTSQDGGQEYIFAHIRNKDGKLQVEELKIHNPEQAKIIARKAFEKMSLDNDSSN